MPSWVKEYACGLGKGKKGNGMPFKNRTERGRESVKGGREEGVGYPWPTGYDCFLLLHCIGVAMGRDTGYA